MHPNAGNTSAGANFVLCTSPISVPQSVAIRIAQAFSDNHEIIRRSVRAVLSSEKSARVGLEAVTGIELFSEIEKLKPDFIFAEYGSF